MALPPQPDIRFLRNTGFALATAAIMAGVLTLFLTAEESRSINLAQDAQTRVTLQLAVASVADSLQPE